MALTCYYSLWFKANTIFTNLNLNLVAFFLIRTVDRMHVYTLATCIHNFQFSYLGEYLLSQIESPDLETTTIGKRAVILLFSHMGENP